MNKKTDNKAKRRNLRLFLISAGVTVCLLGTVCFLMISGVFFGEKTSVAEAEHIEQNSFTVMFCDIDHDIIYEIFIDLNKAEHSVKRIYTTCDPYFTGGLSALTKSVGSICGTPDGGIVVSETQLASLIDTVGGLTCNVTGEMAVACGGIGQGSQTLAGITAIKLFAKEKDNQSVCLSLFEQLVDKWCENMQYENTFLRLLDLCETDISYVDYLPVSAKFSIFSPVT